MTDYWNMQWLLPFFTRVAPVVDTLIPRKENLVLAFLVLDDVAPIGICFATLFGAFPQLSLVVLELLRQRTLGQEKEALLRVGGQPIFSCFNSPFEGDGQF